MQQAEDIEFKLLLDALAMRYGYDFRGYSEASLKRRLKLVLQKTNYASLSILQHELLRSPQLFANVLPNLTVTTSEMFRDPTFFKSLRQIVCPVLRTYPVFKVWHAGCSTGEEVYSLAILLKEEGLYNQATIYATDLNESALKTAKEGIYNTESVKGFTAGYHASGGKKAFSDYYTALYGSVRFDSSLRDNIVFSEHNLATDDVFAEVNLILCRNVLIYFKRELQNRALDLFARSLVYKGYLCLGSKETVKFMEGGEQFNLITPQETIFQKVGMRRLPEGRLAL